MLKTTLLPLLFSTLPFVSLQAESLSGNASPSGTMIELNSLHVYAGGCVVSSELGSGGKQLLRFWSIDQGVHEGIDLAGLEVAVLQTASANMPAGKASPEKSVVYHPENLAPGVREALQSWVAAQLGEALGEVVDTRSADILFDRSAITARLRIGDAIALETAAVEHCDANSCGEAVMYEPLSPVNGFRVAQNIQSKVDEPALNLRWNDHATPSVFIGWFGEQDALEEFCSPSTLVASTN